MTDRPSACDNLTMVRGSLSVARRDEDRVLAGVAGGFADQHGVDPIVVRGALVLLSFAGGLGIALYAIGAGFSTAPDHRPVTRHRRDQLRNASVAAITVGALLVVRSTGLWLGDPFMVPLAVIVAGLALLGVLRPDVGGRPWDALNGSGLGDLAAGRHAAARVIGGTVLVSLGLILVGIGGGVSTSVRAGVFATALTVLGIGVVLGPWMARMVQGVAEERRERIRVEEREAMAAHLHDSVLQTLALIQRTADDPRRTVTLARRQERELRDWLYGTPDAGSTTVAGAVLAMAADVEAAYDVTIDVVLVGDRPVDDRMVAMVSAMREACVNAAKHSGVGAISVFVEVGSGTVGPGGVEAFVKDRGCGFDRTDAKPDRRGIADSIVGRLQRVGGSAEIESSPGDGTEVHLQLPSEGQPSDGRISESQPV